MHHEVETQSMPSSCDATDPAGGVVGETAQTVPFQVSAIAIRSLDALTL